MSSLGDSSRPIRSEPRLSKPDKHKYFDIGATPLSAVAFEAMAPYLRGEVFGNPESIHAAGQAARHALEHARSIIAASLGASKDEIIFTSGATESDNLALKGVALEHYRETGGKLEKKHLLISPLEHPGVSEAAKSLRDFGFVVETLPVTRAGIVTPESVQQRLRPSTLLVSVMAANNQIGTIQDVASLARAAHAGGALFHTDASVYYGLYPLPASEWGVDLATLSAAKLYGPAGVGALFCRAGIKLYPGQHGGGQEAGRRSGTSNLAAIVGFAAAAKAALAKQTRQQQVYQRLSDYFITYVQQNISNVIVNGSPGHRLANNVHLSVLGAEGEALVLRLAQFGLAASSGSACSSRKLQAEPALKALGLSPEEIHGSLRFFWHEWTRPEDLDYLGEKLKIVIAALRKISVYKPGGRGGV